VTELELRRQKQLSSLERLEADAKTWQTLETLLRRIINRLCIAATGRDAELNKELSRINSAIARKADGAELAPMLTHLAAAIAAFEAKQRAAADAVVGRIGEHSGEHAVPPAAASASLLAPGPTSTRIRVLLAEMLERLIVLPEAQSTFAELKALLLGAPSDAVLVSVLTRIADVVNAQHARLQHERDELQRMLQQITQHLDQVAGYIKGEANEQQVSDDSSQEFNTKVLGEVRALGDNVEQASDLVALQQKARLSLQAISGHLRDYRVREELRVSAYRERADGMCARVQELERETRALHESLERQQQAALLDTLTGIPNRLSYSERIIQEFRRWNRIEEPLCLSVWDIDQFKAINDTYGHAAGDKVIRIIAQQLASNVRETDFVARYGGEEFVMILVGASAKDALGLIDNLRKKISELGFLFDRKRVTVTISCGIAAAGQGDTPELLMERADKAMYQAKQLGRNRCAMA
jgi:diguanylate cyclase